MISEDDLINFHQLGYVVVREAFSREVAAECCDLIWAQMASQGGGVKRDDPSSWPAVKCAIDATLREADGPPWSRVYTSRLQAAIDTLCGAGRTEELGLGWWMNTFPRRPTADEPAQPQWGVEGAWHIDGHDFQHFAFSKQIGLVAIMLFTDVSPSGGGTAIAEGSHWDVVQSLCTDFPEGCTNTQVVKKVLEAAVEYDIVEITGLAGDVVLLHPFVLHARSTNLAPFDTSGVGVRIMCHPRIPLKEHMNLRPGNGGMSPLETSVRHIILELVDGEAVLAGLEEKRDDVTRGGPAMPAFGGSELYSAERYTRVAFSPHLEEVFVTSQTSEIAASLAPTTEVDLMEQVLGFCQFKHQRKY